MYKYKISEKGLKDINEVVSDNNSSEAKMSEKISSIISKEWSNIYTIRPKQSLLIGLFLLIAVFLFDYYADLESADQDNYEFMIGLFCSLAAAAFSAMFTGALNLDIKWLQASGTLAVFVLVFLSSPFQSEKKIASTKIIESSELKSYVAVPVLKASFSSGFYLQDNHINYIRIYYPRGVENLKNVALNIKEEILSISNKIEIYSLGSVVSVLSNSAKYRNDKYSIIIKHRPGLDSNMLNNLIRTIDNSGYSIDLKNVKSEYTNADVTIYIKI